jgi:hypothetical protein
MKQFENFKDFKKRLEGMTDEERKEEALLSASDALRSAARNLAFSKAMACMQHGITPEEYDKAFGREYARYSNQFMGKSAIELAVIGLAEIAEAGVDISEIGDMFRGDE